MPDPLRGSRIHPAHVNHEVPRQPQTFLNSLADYPYPEPHSRVALVQMEAVHDECLPAFAHFLRANGYDVQVFLSQKTLDTKGDISQMFRGLIGRMEYLPLTSRGDWSVWAQRLKPFDFLAFNTYQAPGVVNWSLQQDKRILGLVHNPTVMADSIAQGMAQGRVELLTAAAHVTAHMNNSGPDRFARVGTITTAYPEAPTVVPLPPADRIRLALPGSVDFRGRDVVGLVQTVADLRGELGDEAFEVVVVGGGPDRKALEELTVEQGVFDQFRFADLDGDGYVSTQTYFAEMLASDFLLPCLPQLQSTYRRFKITSAMPASLGLGIPAIIDRWTASVYRQPCISYPLHDIVDGVRRAVTMTAEERALLRTSLAHERQAQLAESVAEVGIAATHLFESHWCPRV